MITEQTQTYLNVFLGEEQKDKISKNQLINFGSEQITGTEYVNLIEQASRVVAGGSFEVRMTCQEIMPQYLRESANLITPSDLRTIIESENSMQQYFQQDSDYKPWGVQPQGYPQLEESQVALIPGMMTTIYGQLGTELSRAPNGNDDIEYRTQLLKARKAIKQYVDNPELMDTVIDDLELSQEFWDMIGEVINDFIDGEQDGQLFRDQTLDSITEVCGTDNKKSNPKVLSMISAYQTANGGSSETNTRPTASNIPPPLSGSGFSVFSDVEPDFLEDDEGDTGYPARLTLFEEPDQEDEDPYPDFSDDDDKRRQTNHRTYSPDTLVERLLGYWLPFAQQNVAKWNTDDLNILTRYPVKGLEKMLNAFYELDPREGSPDSRLGKAAKVAKYGAKGLGYAALAFASAIAAGYQGVKGFYNVTVGPSSVPMQFLSKHDRLQVLAEYGVAGLLIGYAISNGAEPLPAITCGIGVSTILEAIGDMARKEGNNRGYMFTRALQKGLFFISGYMLIQHGIHFADSIINPSHASELTYVTSILPEDANQSIADFAEYVLGPKLSEVPDGQTLNFVTEWLPAAFHDVLNSAGQVVEYIMNNGLDPLHDFLFALGVNLAIAAQVNGDEADKVREGR